MTLNDVKILAQEWLHQGFVQVKRYYLQHKLFAGDWSDTFSREVAIRRPAAAVLPYDPKLDKLVLVEQFRIGALAGQSSPWLLEAIAGILEEGETPTELVYREAKEEAGLTLLELIPIYEYWSSPGASNEHVSLFCGKVDASHAQGIYGLTDENEDIRVHAVDVEEAFDWLKQGKISNGICLVALLWFQLHRDEVRAKWSA